MNQYFDVRDVCPCCQSTDSTTLQNLAYCESPMKEHLQAYYSFLGGVDFEYLTDSNYILLECDSCGLIYQRDVPNDFLMNKLYEEWIIPERMSEHYKKKHGARYFYWVAREIAKLVEHAGIRPDHVKFYDFAMGWANWCLIAKGIGCDVYGTELSQTRIENAKASGITVITWEQIPEQQFQIINAEQVFEHLTDPLGTLKYLKKALKPGGIIRINVPQGHAVKQRLETWDWLDDHNSNYAYIPVAPLQHINCFNHDVLLELGKNAGLKAISIPNYFNFRKLRKRDKVRSAVKKILTPVLPARKRNPVKPCRVYLTHAQEL